MISRWIILGLCLFVVVQGRDRTESDIGDLMRLLKSSSEDYKLLKQLYENENMRRDDRQEKLNEILLKQTQDVQDMFEMKMGYEDAVDILHEQEFGSRLATASPAQQKYFEEVAKLRNDMSLTVADFKAQMKKLVRQHKKNEKHVSKEMGLSVEN
ncbi:hypothetical protein L596_022926 [Steinernema carpocapsae]|uniref:SXP/RAL-2 family protein Ani s 5-like cation-binding domain-containing protein n=1 Tax=Steinernema carpocapsae TaxID=34508 RepID=A0A4U5MC09_STECR|nr:hypothetical protein L596_022926 [Steinernema carpocapsae]